MDTKPASSKDPVSREASVSGEDVASRTEDDASSSFFIGVALFLMVVAFLGFWPSYFGPLLQGEEITMRLPTRIQPWVIHLHAALFMGWMVTLLVQTLLIARQKTRTHMTLGRYGLALGGVVVVVALLVVVLRTDILVSETEITLSMSHALNLGIVLQPILFGLFLGLGYLNRSRPEAHKRYMLFATVSIMPAATGRMAYILGGWSMQIMFAVFVGLIISYDYLSRDRPHRVSLIGVGLLLVNVIVFSLPFTHGG